MNAEPISTFYSQRPTEEPYFSGCMKKFKDHKNVN